MIRPASESFWLFQYILVFVLSVLQDIAVLLEAIIYTCHDGFTLVHFMLILTRRPPTSIVFRSMFRPISDMKSAMRAQ